MKSRFTFVFLLFLTTIYAQAPSDVYEWNEVPQADLDMTVCDFEPEAKALVLQDVCIVDVAYENTWVDYFVYKCHRRVKIFDKTALDAGNLVFYFFKYNKRSSIKDLKVQVILSDGTRTYVRDEDVKIIRFSKYKYKANVFIPNVQVGSVIEYSYTLHAHSYTPRDHYMQYEYPVRTSYYTTTIPDDFDYSIMNRMPVTPTIDSFYKTRTGILGRKIILNNRDLVLHNIPSYRMEPYCNAPSNYRGLLRYQLDGYEGYRGYIAFRKEWEELAKELEESSYFGAHFDHGLDLSYIWKKVKGEIDKSMSIREKAEAIRAHVSEHVEWDGEHELGVNAKSLSQVYKDGKGNSTEISLILVGLLQNAGLDAWPVLVSTQDHGYYFYEYPMLRQFNTCMVWVNERGPGFIIDGTHPDLGVDLARPEMYNRSGWVVNKKAPFWKDFKVPMAENAYLLDIQINKDGASDVHMTYKSTKQEYLKDIQQLKSAESKDEFAESLFREGISVQNMEHVQVDKGLATKHTFKGSFTCAIEDFANESGGLLFIEPVLAFDFYESPFIALKRQFPINFNYPFSTKYIATITAPEGYGFSDLPEPLRILLPYDGGKFSYSAKKQADNKLQLIIQLKIIETDYHPEGYGIIWEFFDQFSGKLQESIVLEKL